jgi:myo-inositol-1(or 4)-monophosphatase
VAPWDVAAGRVIAAEAGAVVHIRATDGRTLVLAAAPGIAEALATVLAGTGVLVTTP